MSENFFLLNHDDHYNYNQHFTYHMIIFLNILGLFLFLLIIFQHFVPTIKDLSINSAFCQDLQMMIGVITNTTFSSKRVQSILKTWGPSFLNLSFSSE